MNNEEINKKLLDDLKNLPKVDAPKNFETELWRKINSSEKEIKESIWDKIFSPGKIAPAAVAVVSAVIIFFVVDVNSEEMEDPLNIEPRLREDLIVYEMNDDISVQNEIKTEIKKKDDESIIKSTTRESNQNKISSEIKSEEIKDESRKELDKKITDDELSAAELKLDTNASSGSRTLGGTVSPAVITTNSSEINKSNLNFMQRNLTVEEKVEVQQLKMKVETQKSAKTDENLTNPTQK